MSKYTVKTNQSVFDVALAVYGANEGAAWLVEDNDLQSWAVAPGQELIVRDEVIDPAVVGYLERKNIIPSTDEPDQTPPDFNNDFNPDFL